MLKCCLIILSRCSICHGYEKIYVDMFSNNFISVYNTFVTTISVRGGVKKFVHYCHTFLMAKIPYQNICYMLNQYVSSSGTKF